MGLERPRVASAARQIRVVTKGKALMSEEQVNPERPYLHCMMVELIDDFFAEYPAKPGASDKVDTGEADEVIIALQRRWRN
jgi:hypothetical protein